MSKKLLAKLNLVQVNTTSFEEEDFILLTTLTEIQIKNIIEPIVLDERKGEAFYDNDDLVWSLKEAYPKELVEMYTINGIETLSI